MERKQNKNENQVEVEWQKYAKKTIESEGISGIMDLPNAFYHRNSSHINSQFLLILPKAMQ